MDPSLEIPDPDDPVTNVEVVEERSEEVANRLLTFSDKLRRRDFTAAAEWLSESFHGHAFAPLEVAEERVDHLGLRHVRYDVETRTVTPGAGFLASLADAIGPWSAVESALWKVKGAEFQKGRRARWGKIKLYVHMTGISAEGDRTSLAGWGYARVEKESGAWMLTRFQLTSLDQSSRPGTVFTDVSAAAGVGHVGGRFGRGEGNDSYAWNGAASADVDGDGFWDVFLPSDGRNFLYMGRADGRFDEQARERGVLAPDAGTGAVFFDFDNDGDQDLAVGQIGWRAADGKLEGRTPLLYVNDGKGSFTENGAALGLSEPFVAYSLTVLDYDADGFLDLFLCSYGRIEAEHNNSWIQATNGSPNALLRNEDGKRFVDVAEQAGVRGTSWSYAAAAADIDRDGDVDLYVANDYGDNELFLGSPEGRFTEAAASLGVVDHGNGMGVAWGDLSNDGRVDLYVSNMSSTAGNRILGRLDADIGGETFKQLKKLAAGNSIFLANEKGGFEVLPSSAGGINASWAWSVALADFDLDGRLDAFCTNGFVTGDQPFDT
ncbi:MAG: VCBS repeat-containing protein [bacterium]|nr:VCBS repeat-containing protein [bacterium]